MSQHEKLLERLRRKPTDFTWSELQKLLGGLGFKEITGSGSRRRFVHDEWGPITLHQPHPTDVLKKYQVDQIVTYLREKKII